MILLSHNYPPPKKIVLRIYFEKFVKTRQGTWFCHVSGNPIFTITFVSEATEYQSWDTLWYAAYKILNIIHKERARKFDFGFEILKKGQLKGLGTYAEWLKSEHSVGQQWRQKLDRWLSGRRKNNLRGTPEKD